jgi:hypothetical protein
MDFAPISLARISGKSLKSPFLLRNLTFDQNAIVFAQRRRKKFFEPLDIRLVDEQHRDLNLRDGPPRGIYWHQDSLGCVALAASFFEPVTNLPHEYQWRCKEFPDRDD